MARARPGIQVRGRIGRYEAVARRPRSCFAACTIAVAVFAGMWVHPVTAGAAAGPTSSPTTIDPVAQRDTNQRRQRQLGSQVAALNGSNDELRAALGDVDARLDAARLELLAAQQSYEAEAAVATAAEAAESAARDDVDRSTVEVRVVAVEAYVNSPENGLAAVVTAPSMDDALVAVSLLRQRAQHRAAVLDGQRRALAQLEDASKAAQAAAQNAESRRDSLASQVSELDSERERRASLVSEVERRIDVALTEAAGLQALDAKLARSIAEQQAPLVAAANKPAPARPAVKVPPKGPVATPTQAPGPATPTNSTSPSTAPPATVPPITPPVTIPPPALRTTHGITVAASIADQVGALIDAATAAGLRISGSGYRNPQSQIDLRRKHCGPTDYDIWLRPASQCSPPTARPGLSNHERGMALDLTCGGVLIRSHDDPCFVWLTANAANFGLFNLPSEPWHWSINGN